MTTFLNLTQKWDTIIVLVITYCGYIGYHNAGLLHNLNYVWRLSRCEARIYMWQWLTCTHCGIQESTIVSSLVGILRTNQCSVDNDCTLATRYHNHRKHLFSLSSLARECRLVNYKLYSRLNTAKFYMFVLVGEKRNQ